MAVEVVMAAAQAALAPEELLQPRALLSHLVTACEWQWAARAEADKATEGRPLAAALVPAWCKRLCLTPLSW